MNRKTFAMLIAVVTFTVGVLLAKVSFLQTEPTIPPNSNLNLPIGKYKLSGPYIHENLTIFLIHLPDLPNSKLFLPLQEAMERKLVIVHETSDVNQLAIENVSKTEEVLVQAGDIVKGGQQDRVLSVDLILPSRSGKMPIDAFCVEHGRWYQRGAERAEQFNSSNDMIATKDLKIAAKQLRSQAEVWKEVDTAQGMFRGSVGTEVRSAASRTSLQLSIENEKVQEAAAAYVKDLLSIVEGKQDVIGFIFAINAKINSADLYASNTQFKRFWPKLLRTTAIEAVAERPQYQKGETVSAERVDEFLTDAGLGQQSISDVTKRTLMIKRETEERLFFETRDMEQSGNWVHRSYLAK